MQPGFAHLNSPTNRQASRFSTPLLLVLQAAVGFGCAPADEPMARPNVLVVSVDTLRADHLGAFGYGRETSPFLDSLAREGVRFERAFAPASWTLPSHMSLFTSSYPHTHRVENEQRSLPEAIPTLATILRDAGYRTTGFVSWVYLSASFGFDQGFDAFHELLPPAGQRGPDGHYAVKAGPFVDEVLAWADESPGEPFFLFLHLCDPHMSYEPPLEIAREFDPTLDGVQHGDYDHLKQYIRGLHPAAVRVGPDELARATALYDGEIRYTDTELGRLFLGLEQRGLLDETLIVFNSDHGEEFDDHGSMEGHGWTLYDEVLHVPLILVFPDGRGAGATVERVVQTIDVAPTILDLLDLSPPPSFEGSGQGSAWGRASIRSRRPGLCRRRRRSESWCRSASGCRARGRRQSRCRCR